MAEEGPNAPQNGDPVSIIGATDQPSGILLPINKVPQFPETVLSPQTSGILLPIQKFPQFPESVLSPQTSGIVLLEENAAPQPVTPSGDTGSVPATPAESQPIAPQDPLAIAAQQPSTAAAADPTAIESDIVKRRREEERRNMLRNQQQQEQNGGLILLLAMLFGALENGNEGLKDENTSSSFAKWLGLDVGTFRQTVSDVSSGRLSAQDAASRTYGSVNPASIDYSRAPSVPVADLLRTNRGPTLLNPDLVQAMQKNTTINNYVQMTFAAAQRHGLDGNLLANQLWQESKYRPDATSGVGARGIGQFMPFHKGKWGLETDADFRDPTKSIEASARFMRHLTDRVGSQQLALVAYNGGEKAVEWVSSRTPGSKITVDDWMNFAGQQRAQLGVGSANLWRNQTFDYVTKIDSNYWSRDLIAKAERQGQTTTLAAAGFPNGVDQTTRPPSAGRDGLTPVYTATQGAGGTDQVALAARTETPASGITPNPTTVRPT